MKRWKAGMVFIMIALFLDVVNFGIVVPVTPTLLASFVHGDLTVATKYYGYFLAIYGVAQFAFAPALGALSDQYGRRPLLLVAMFGAAVDLFTMAFAPTLTLLFVGRTIAGITAASASVCGAYIADVSPPEKRAANFGLMGGAFGIGFIVGPAIGGMLGSFGPRVPFMVAGCLSLVNWLYGVFILPESLAPENRRKFEWKFANPIATPTVLHQYGVLLLAFVSLGLTFAQTSIATVMVISNKWRFDWSTTEQGLSLALAGIATALVQAVLLRPIVKKFGEQKVVIIALVGSIACHVLYAAATHGWMINAIIAVQALSWLGGPAIAGLISNGVPDDKQGAVQGALSSLGSIVEFTCPLVSSWVFVYFTAAERTDKSPGAAFLIGAVVNGLALVAFLYAYARGKLPRAAAQPPEEAAST